MSNFYYNSHNSQKECLVYNSSSDSDYQSLIHNSDRNLSYEYSSSHFQYYSSHDTNPSSISYQNYPTSNYIINQDQPTYSTLYSYSTPQDSSVYSISSSSYPINNNLSEINSNLYFHHHSQDISLYPSPSSFSLSSESTTYTTSPDSSDIDNSSIFQPISSDIFDKNFDDDDSSLTSNSTSSEESQLFNELSSSAYFPLSKNKKKIENIVTVQKKSIHPPYATAANIYSSSNSSSRIVRKAYKSSYVPVSPFPKIIKRDFRRFFPQMIANVFNSGDIDFFTTFIHQFFTPSFQIYKVCDNYPNTTDSSTCLSKYQKRPASLYLNRSQYILFYFFLTLQSPHTIVKTSNVVLKQRINDPNTYLYFTFEINPIASNDVKHAELPDNFFQKLFTDRRNLNEIVDDLKIEKRKLLSENNKNYSENSYKRNEIEEEEIRLLNENYVKVPNNFKKEIFGDYFHIKPTNLNKPPVITSQSFIIFNENNRVVYNRQSIV